MSSKTKKSYEIEPTHENVEAHQNNLESFEFPTFEKKTGQGTHGTYNPALAEKILSEKGLSVSEARELLGKAESPTRGDIRDAWRNARPQGFRGLALRNTIQGQRYFIVSPEKVDAWLKNYRSQGYTIVQDSKFDY